MDEPPPKATKIWMITQYGNGFAGEWYPECGAVAWSPLPKLDPEQKRRLIAASGAGIDPTKHQRDDYAQRNDGPDETGICCPR